MRHNSLSYVLTRKNESVLGRNDTINVRRYVYIYLS